MQLPRKLNYMQSHMAMCLLLLLLLLLQLLPEVSGDEANKSVDPLRAVMKLHQDSDEAFTSEGLQNMIDFAKNATNFAYIMQLKNRIKDKHLNCETAQSLLNSSESASSKLSESELRQMLPEILLAMQNPTCFDGGESKESIGAIAWVYSAVAVTVMKIAALSGILMFPCMSARIYTMALSFLVPLAVSSLLGSTLFIFIPKTLSLEDVPHYDANFGTPILKLGALGVGIYIFYLIEKVLRLVMERKEKQFFKKSGTFSAGSYNLEIATDSSDSKPTRKISTTMAGDITSFPTKNVMSRTDSRIEFADSQQQQQQQEEKDANQAVAPIAWIALMGDCIRNFIDGTAIGAAFSINLFTGISLSVAFIFEEIPTELGDVAILLNAGMSLCRATMLHFFAAIFAYIGAGTGILLGDLGSGELWIFAISAGAFLYIALVDLMPEMNHTLDSDKAKEIGRMKIFILQNCGLVLGYVVTGLLGYYGDIFHFDFGDEHAH